jgi:hypothetical protein
MPNNADILKPLPNSQSRCNKMISSIELYTEIMFHLSLSFSHLMLQKHAVDKVSLNKSMKKRIKVATFTKLNIMVSLHYNGPTHDVPLYLHHTWNTLWHRWLNLTNFNITSSYWTNPTNYLELSPSEANSCFSPLRNSQHICNLKVH